MRALPGVLDGTIVFDPQSPTEPPPADPDVLSTFDAEFAAAVGLDCRTLVQDHRVRLRRGQVHGLRLRTDGGEGNLVSCCAGSVLGVAVDLRPASASYRSWMSLVLDDAEARSVWLPPGFAHGYQALSEVATVCCRANRVRQPGRETLIAPQDPDLAIPWPLPVPSLGQAGGATGATAELAAVEPFLGDWFGALS